MKSEKQEEENKGSLFYSIIIFGVFILFILFIFLNYSNLNQPRIGTLSIDMRVENFDDFDERGKIILQMDKKPINKEYTALVFSNDSYAIAPYQEFYLTKEGTIDGGMSSLPIEKEYQIIVIDEHRKFVTQSDFFNLTDNHNGNKFCFYPSLKSIIEC